MALKLEKFDIASHLKCNEDIELYLNEIVKNNNPKLLHVALDYIAKAKSMNEEITPSNILSKLSHHSNNSE